MVFIKIDLAPSTAEIVLVAERQRVMASASASLRPTAPRPGWSEDDPDASWDAVDQTMLSLRHQHPAWLRGVEAIGLSGQNQSVSGKPGAVQSHDGVSLG